MKRTETLIPYVTKREGVWGYIVFEGKEKYINTILGGKETPTCVFFKSTPEL